MKKAIVFPLIFSFIVFAVAPVLGAELKLVASGKNTFILQGIDLPKVGGIKAVIQYTNMTDPVVQRGSIIQNTPSPMFISNVNTPGTITIAALQGDNLFSGTGPIAIISFKAVSGKTGRARLTAQELATHEGQKDVKGDSSDVPVADSQEPIDTSGGGGSETQTPATTQTPTTPTEVTDNNRGGMWLGSVTMPTDNSSRTEAQQHETQQEKVSEQPSEVPQQYTPQEPSSIAQESQPVERPREPETTQAGSQKFTAHKGLLDQFREYKGEMTPQALTALVAGFSIPGVKQEPPMVLSDGKTAVKVYIELPGAGKQSPNFALKGARLVSLNNDETGKWIIEALPAKNANDVRVTALQDNVMTEIPLTVAQPVAATAVSPQGAWDESAFALFLKERGADKTPRFDLNGDGVRNHIDDYICTVNYLMHNPKATGGKNGEKQLKPAQPPPAPAAKPVPAK